MSLKAMAWAWDQQGLTTTEKFVLIAIADHASDEGWCFPSLKHIMNKTGLSSPRYCRKVVSNLVVKGRLNKKSRFKNGRQMSNLYKLNYDFVVYIGGGSIEPGGGGSIGQGGGGSTEHPIEPSVKNPQNEPSKDEASPSSQNTEKPMLGGNKKPIKGSVPVTSDALKGFLSDQKPEPNPTLIVEDFLAKKLTGAVLAQFWRRIIPAYHPDYGPMAELKQKEVAHLIQLRKYFGEKAVQSIAHIVSNWISFTKYAESHHGAYKSPLLPSLPYMVLNSQAAISYCAIEVIDVQSIALKNQKHHTIVKEKPKAAGEKEQEKPMTLDEFEKIEEEFKPKGD